MAEDETEVADTINGPRKSHGWRTTEDLRAVYMGGVEKITQELRRLRESLIEEIVEQMGLPQEEATEVVELWLIGPKKRSRGPAGLAISPDAERLLPLTPKSEAAPPKTAGWQSAQQLCKVYIGGSGVMNRKLAELRQQLIGDVEAAGIEGGEEVVDRFLVGRRKPAGGQESLAISPEGIRLAEHLGIICARSPQQSRE
jgi:hypothetical protein